MPSASGGMSRLGSAFFGRSLANPDDQSTTGPRLLLESMAVFADSLLDSGIVLHGS
jgi:hypothetical protein